MEIDCQSFSLSLDNYVYLIKLITFPFIYQLVQVVCFTSFCLRSLDNVYKLDHKLLKFDGQIN